MIKPHIIRRRGRWIVLDEQSYWWAYSYNLARAWRVFSGELSQKEIDRDEGRFTGVVV